MTCLLTSSDHTWFQQALKDPSGPYGDYYFFVDGEPIRSVPQSPGYPMQLIAAVFDFPDWPGPADHVPRLELDWVATLGPGLSA